MKMKDEDQVPEYNKQTTKNDASNHLLNVNITFNNAMAWRQLRILEFMISYLLFEIDLLLSCYDLLTSQAQFLI